MLADMDKSFLAFSGGPRGGNSGVEKVGVMALGLGPAFCPEEELEVELCDLVKWKAVVVLVTIRLDGRKVRVTSTG